MWFLRVLAESMVIQTVTVGEFNMAAIAESESETEVMLDRHCVVLIMYMDLIRFSSFKRLAKSLHRPCLVAVTVRLNHRRCVRMIHAFLP